MVWFTRTGRRGLAFHLLAAAAILLLYAPANFSIWNFLGFEVLLVSSLLVWLSGGRPPSRPEEAASVATPEPWPAGQRLILAPPRPGAIAGACIRLFALGLVAFGACVAFWPAFGGGLRVVDRAAIAVLAGGGGLFLLSYMHRHAQVFVVADSQGLTASGYLRRTHMTWSDVEDLERTETWTPGSADTIFRVRGKAGTIMFFGGWRDATAVATAISRATGRPWR